MQHYAPDDYMYGDYIMNGMCQQEISLLLSYLSASNMRIIHISQQNKFAKKSFWYQVPYQIENIAIQQINRWENEAIAAHFTLPESNPYIVKTPITYPCEQAVEQQKKHS